MSFRGRGFPGENVPVLYLVVERYLAGPEPVCERAAACGRMLPEGLVYVTARANVITCRATARRRNSLR